MDVVLNGLPIDKLRFGYSLIKRLGERWGLKDVQEIFMKILKTFDSAEKDMFSAIDIVAEMVVESAALEGIDLNINDVSDNLFQNMEVITDVVKVFFDSIPNPNQKTGKTDPVKKKMNH